MWIKILVIMGFMWVLQGVLTYFQIKNFQRKLKEMKKHGRVGVGTVKGRLGAGAIVILAADRRGRIVDAQRMSGISVFARFRPLKGIKDLYYWEISHTAGDYDRVTQNSLLIAADSLKKQYEGDGVKHS
ncbi:transcriptional regulator GutM [Thermoanaerobacterium sp. DL9XJH110]|uniref:transcriptional regulator GutM n=1 Tax=Thermoanaerobacterium sp. DL9XJH110 TaxID=3386643 RepID=UPI003BB6B067